MEQTFSRQNHEDQDFIPGTIRLFNDGKRVTEDSLLKKNDKDIILQPQPTDSPNDPLNWSWWRKLYQFAVLAFITGLTAAITNDPGPEENYLNESYGMSWDQANTAAGVLFIFIGYTTIVLAPASSLYGRKITYLICLLAGCLGCVWLAVAKGPGDLIGSQVFIGMSESCSEAQVQQSLADMYYLHQLGSVLTVYILAISVGTFAGPLIAGFVPNGMNWRWVGWWGAIFCGATLVVTLFSLEETVFDRGAYVTTFDALEVNTQESAPETDEAKKTVGAVRQLGMKTHEEAALEEPRSYWKSMAIITPSPYLRGWGFKQYIYRFFIFFKIFMLPPVWLSGLLWGLQDAYLSFYLTTEEDYFADVWGFSENRVAILNVPTLIGSVIGCIVAGIGSDYFVIWMAKKRSGWLEAEYRLFSLIVPMVLSPVGLIMFGVGSQRRWPYWVIYGGLGLIGYGWGSVGDSAMNYMMDSYPETVIQGMVGTAIINNSLGAIFTFVCSYWLESLGNQNTYIALAVINFVTIGCFIPFVIWGKKMREWTKPTYLSIVDATQGMG